MQGWPSARQVPVGGGQVPPPDVARVAARDGSTPLGIGIALLFIGGVLLLLTFRSPSFDPDGATRAPMTEGRATIDVAEAGYYVAYVETTDCRGGFVQFTQPGQPVAQSTPAAGSRYPEYRRGDMCGTALGLYALTAPGTWTAESQLPLTGNIAFYLQDRRPTRIEAGTLWIGVGFLVAGAAVGAYGFTQRRRWSRVNAKARPPAS